MLIPHARLVSWAFLRGSPKNALVEPQGYNPEPLDTRINVCPGYCYPKAFRVHVPNDWVLQIWVLVLVVQVPGKHSIFECLDA